MAAIGRKSDLENIAAARAGMEHGAAPPFPVRVDEVADRSVQPRLRQRLDHEAALPRAIARKAPMLDGAAAAGAEMRADRRNAFGTWQFHRQQTPPVRMTRHRLDLDGFAGQGVRHIDGGIASFGYSVAAMAHAGDGQPLSHAALR